MLYKVRKSASPEDFAGQLHDYLANILHTEIRLKSWDGTNRLPNFVVRRYRFLTGTIVHQPCLFAIDLDPGDDTPAQIKKQIAGMEREFSGIVVYTADRLAANRRARFIATNIAFAVPGNQLYVPALAIDLREMFRRSRDRGSERLSPAAQLTFFYCILFKAELQDNAARTPSRMAEALGYSAMSIGRAYDELAALGLATVLSRGRQKVLSLDQEPRQLLEESRQVLRSPVQSMRFARFEAQIPPMKIAGETALSHITGLSPPELPVYAIDGDDWKALSAGNIEELGTRDQADASIEVWHYRPELLSGYATVDPLSLYAQFQDHPNERIAKAAEDALKHVPW
jgi:hypothetical protein